MKWVTLRAKGVIARAVIHNPPDDHSSGNNVLHPAKRTLKRDYNKNGTHPSGMWGS